MYQVRLNIFSSLFLLLINILLWAIKNVWYPGPKVTFPVWGVVAWCANWEATGRSSCSEVVHRAPSRRQSGTLSSFVREAPELLLLFFVLVRMVPGLSLLVVLASACSAFNLDTENVVRKTSGDPNSLFGFSMTMHRQLQPEDKTLWALNFLFVTWHDSVNCCDVIQTPGECRRRSSQVFQGSEPSVI